MRTLTTRRLPVAAALLAVLLGPPVAGGADPCSHDYRNQNLTDRNFSRLDLQHACFQGATLDGAQFVGSLLDGAHFDGAKIGVSAKGPASFAAARLRSASFAGAHFGAVDLQYADLTCTDLSKTDLTAASVSPLPRIDADYARAKKCRTRFEGARLLLEQFPAALWRWAILNDARLPDLTPDAVSFEGADLGDVIFHRAPLAGFNLKRATLDNADLTGADLRLAHLDGARMHGVVLRDAVLDFATLTGADLAPAGQRKSDLSGATLPNAVLDGAVLTSATLRGANLAGASLRCARIGEQTRCADLSNAALEGDSEHDSAALSGADLSGANLQGAALNGVSFENATLIGAVFDGTTMSGTVFTGANLARASFQKNATLSGVIFYNAGLQNAKFVGATLTGAGKAGQGVDFSCTQLGGADFTNAVVQRAKFGDAVTPPGVLCCPQTDQPRYCGTVQSTGGAYGPTVLPRLTQAVICPNGDVAICTGDQWRIPKWQTSHCNSAHATETVWTPPDCDHSHHGDVVPIPDLALKRCLQRAFLGGRDEPITKQLASTVSRVTCPGQRIGKVQGLDAFENLVHLDLSGNQIADAAPIESLARLQVLRVADNQITELDLRHMGDLIALDLSGNPLASLRGTVSVYLETVDLSGTRLEGSDPLHLGIQTDLFFADLSDNRLTGLGDLSKLTKLTRLYLSKNQLTQVAGLGALACPADSEPALEFVSLACNPKLDCRKLGLDKCSDGRQLLHDSGCGENDLPECRSAAPPAAALPACVPSSARPGATVYVSSSGKDAPRCGASPQQACATIAAGIASCKRHGGACAVLVEYGSYPAAKTIELAAGVSLYGGCFFDRPPRSGGPWYSLVEAGPAAQPALHATGIGAETTVRGFTILAATAVSPGAASVAVQTENSAALTLAHSKLVAGNGADGSPGNGGHAGGDGGKGGNVSGRNGTGGAGGKASCSNADGGSGAPPSSMTWYKCPGGPEGCCPFLACGCNIAPVNQGSAGEPGDTGEWADGGQGATGKAYAGCPAIGLPDGGEIGHPGKNGACGARGQAANDLYGAFVQAQWKAGRGGTAGRGGDGGGGGGGGSGGACDVPCGFKICPGNLFSGQAGGGGGAGGCGGTGGEGGQMGGASLAFTAVGKAPRLDTLVVIAATGGRGGHGGAGRGGGKGGDGGGSYSHHVCDGFDPDNATGAAGGAGNKGGRGGASGGGAGGNGGPAIGVALVAGSNLHLDTVTFYSGYGGTPGEGGGGGGPTQPGLCRGPDGEKGKPGAVADHRAFTASEDASRGPAAPENFPPAPPRPVPESATSVLPSRRSEG